MKTVFTENSTIAHLWANQNQDQAKNPSRNFYFNESTIYSYGSHFPIAKHVTNENGAAAVLFTTRSYSNTTSKHISIVRGAANHLNLIYCYNPDHSHNQNFNEWQRNIEQIGTKLINARKPEIYLNQIASEYAQAVKYADFFGVNIPENLKVAASINNRAEYIQYNELKTAALLAEKERKEKQAKKDLKQSLEKWRAFKVHRLYDRIDQDYLRYNIDTERFETSQQVQIPLEIARKFYNYIIDTIKSGGCKECNSKIMDYQVTEINKKFIRVGCHKITIQEINKIAKYLI